MAAVFPRLMAVALVAAVTAARASVPAPPPGLAEQLAGGDDGLVGFYGGCAGTVPEEVIPADPGNYLGLVASLGPGDLLQLAAGTYSGGLPILGLTGEPDRCIVIEGPAAGAPAVFTGRDCCNTVSIVDASYVVIRHLTLDGEGRQGDGVKAEGTSQFAHHITLEDLRIVGHGADQQIVGINTKCPAWNWVVRANVVDGAGTGMYFGNSDGEDEFVASLVEYNLVLDTLGYNAQIKHQNGRATGLGSPASGTTILRHNVFSKAAGAAGGANARPNLLLGHWPLSGPGSSDEYHAYGNLFYQNETGTEPLFQAEGHVAFYANLLYNGFGNAVQIQPHEDVPRKIRVFHNTVVAAGTGISVASGHPAFEQRVVGNAVFAATPLSGGIQVDNATGSFAAAAAFLNDPSGVLPGMDLYPLPGALSGPPEDPTGLAGFTDGDRDFNGAFHPGTFRGAYAGEGENPGWPLALERKPEVGAPIFADGFESGDASAWSLLVP
jgi:hypothetical protein